MLFVPHTETLNRDLYVCVFYCFGLEIEATSMPESGNPY